MAAVWIALSAAAGATVGSGVGWGAAALGGGGGAVGATVGGTRVPPVLGGGVGGGVGVPATGGATAVDLLLRHWPLARCSAAASSAAGKSGAYCSMSLGTSRCAAASSLALYLQPSTRPVR